VFLRSLLHWSRNGNPVPQSPSGSGSASSPRELYRPLPISQIPNSASSHQLANTLIDAYFTNYHTTYPFLHEATFRAQYSELVKRPEKHVWHMLLNTVLALGAWTIGDEGSDLDDLFYREASRYSHDHSIFESASLSLVQALLLLSNYVQKRNKPNTGWNYLGLAVRMALSLGLHREFPEWSISMLQREMRRRVWWGLFIFDSGASMTFGRTILLPESDMMDVRPVLNVPDEVCEDLTGCSL
jgi:transcriptional regulatory protein GAL4